MMSLSAADMNAEHLMPYFVNYPTDWAKMGLRNYPKLALP